MKEYHAKRCCGKGVEHCQDPRPFRRRVFLAKRLYRESYAAAYDRECQDRSPLLIALRQPDLFKDECSDVCEDRYEEQLIDRYCHQVIILRRFVSDDH